MATVKIHTVDPQTGETIIIAEGEIGKDLIEADGSYYFMPAAVNHELLEMTDETYTCPYKGLCNYYNLKDEEGNVVKTQASWIYETPNDGWEQIAGKYGFYIQDNDGIITEVDGEDEEEGPGTDNSMLNVINQG